MRVLCVALIFVLSFPLYANAAAKTHTNSIGMKFALIPAGEFVRIVGKDAFGENLGATVTISKPFYMGIYEVTQEQWHAVMGANPSFHKGRTNPVECVSWDDTQIFIRKLNEKEGHNRYRLPTEAEWHYAALGGQEHDFLGAKTEKDLTDYAWFTKNSERISHPVGQKKPNRWGLFDVLGNVFEWTQDYYGEYPVANVTDPKGPSSGSARVIRGGSWNFDARDCSAAERGNSSADYRGNSFGFRLALSPE